MSGKKNGNEYILDLCKEFKDEKFFGYYSLGKPMLVIQDLEMMKSMKTKDFRHFPDTQDENISRTLRTGGDLDSLFNHNVGSARGDEWRDVRSSRVHLWKDEGNDEVHRGGVGEPSRRDGE